MQEEQIQSETIQIRIAMRTASSALVLTFASQIRMPAEPFVYKHAARTQMDWAMVESRRSHPIIRDDTQVLTFSSIFDVNGTIFEQR